MPLPAPVVPGVTDFNTVFSTLNETIANVPDGSDFDGVNLNLKNGATPLFSVALPPSPNARVSGLTFTNTNRGVLWTAGSYIYNGVKFNVDAGGVSLAVVASAARIDLVIGNAAGVITVIQGVESVNPVAPTLTGGTLLEAYYIQSNTEVYGDQVFQPPMPANIGAQVVEVQINSVDVTLNNLSALTQIAKSGCNTVTLPSAPIVGRPFQIKNKTGSSLDIDPQSFDIDTVGGVYALADLGCLTIKFADGEWNIISLF